jgi:hypothetical protein
MHVCTVHSRVGAPEASTLSSGALHVSKVATAVQYSGSGQLRMRKQPCMKGSAVSACLLACLLALLLGCCCFTMQCRALVVGHIIMSFLLGMHVLAAM